jgi:hypothetical protein
MLPTGLALALLTTGAAIAQVPFPAPTLPLDGGLAAFTAGQWYAVYHQASASTLIGDVESTQEVYHLPIRAGELVAAVTDSQTIGSKSAAGTARATLASLGTSAAAGDPLHPDSTFAGALSFASISYVAVLDSQTQVRLNLKLDGRLGVTGSRALGDDRSSAAVAVSAFGSLPEGTDADYRALYAGAGIDPDAEGTAMLAQLKAWPTSSQTHLTTFGAQADTSHNLVTVHETLQVTAEGTKIDCDPSLASICGKYVYYAGVFLFTEAQNGAFADFSHTLSIASFSIGGGEALPFAPAAPVPEPASVLLMAAGLAALAGWRRRAV